MLPFTQYFKLNQTLDQNIAHQSGRFSYRYAFYRSSEAFQMEEPGQDYLTFGTYHESFVFAICDGVGLSFYGDVAARILGDSLIKFMGSDCFESEVTHEQLDVLVSRFLANLTISATNDIDSIALSEQLSPLLREVLEEKRLHGSESMFVCGRIDLPSITFPTGRLISVWQGDSRFRIWNHSGEECTRMLGDSFNTSQRWSTRKGVVGGDPNIFLSTLSDETSPHRLLIYTDGLNVLDQYNMGLNADLQSHITDIRNVSNHDDMTLLEVWW